MLIHRIKNSISDKIQYCRDLKLSPERLHSGDTYIVEFPKSGVTWLTMLIANAFAIQYDMPETITFASVRRFIPDLHASRAEAPRLSPTGLGFYKSHAKFNRNYVSTIYLARHPLRVMHSYQKFRATLDPRTPETLESFIDDPVNGLIAWKQHIRSWLMTPRDSAQRQLHLVRYEDLIKDTEGVLSDLSINLGWGLSENSIKDAVKRSLREEMQSQENIYRRHNPTHVLDFVGSGQPDLTSKIEEQVRRRCANELKILGYE